MNWRRNTHQVDQSWIFWIVTGISRHDIHKKRRIKTGILSIFCSVLNSRKAVWKPHLLGGSPHLILRRNNIINLSIGQWPTYGQTLVWLYSRLCRGRLASFTPTPLPLAQWWKTLVWIPYSRVKTRGRKMDITHQRYVRLRCHSPTPGTTLHPYRSVVGNSIPLATSHIPQTLSEIEVLSFIWLGGKKTI